MGTLFVVATPIGNLEDITLRALRVLREADVIAAEDTRHTRKLLTHSDIHTPLQSFHEHSGRTRVADLVQRLDEGDVALVTDAGTPGVSDPGAALVTAAVDAGHDVVPVPGASAVATALSVSGITGDAYVFLGFLPRRRNDRLELLRAVSSERRTLVAFESPHRIKATLGDLAESFGTTRTIAVTRELTKAYEEVWRGTTGQADELWSGREPRGEFTLVIAGADDLAPELWPEERLHSALVELRDKGVGARGGSKALAAESGWQARDIYRMWHIDEPTEDHES